MVVARRSPAGQLFVLRKISLLFLPILIAFAILTLQFIIVRSAGELTVEIVAGYNLVVDSNVKSPSTFGPEVATVMGKFCNTTSATLTNVYGYIGNSTTHTPGVYPVFNSADLDSSHVLYNTGIYSFTHMGGRTGTADATRYIGNLTPGQCNVQYWHIIYPQCENVGGKLATPPCVGDAVWGLPTDPTDDLKLRLDMWAKADGSIEATPKMFSMTLRNEISAMANKIEPNPMGAWFNTKGNTVVPGDVITSNGVHYELGRVNKGFDNNNDGLFDFNAWMQPIGRQSFDPNCFRLIRTTGLLTVSRSGGNPPMIVNFTDQLYFTNLPSDNNGIIGNVYYTFMALGGPCSVDLSPYQEVASGADNEKFNADFGTGIPPVMTYAPAVSIDKLSSPNIVRTGTTYTYTIPFANSGTGSAGLFLSTENITMPLVISDTLPVGMYYVGASADCSIDGATTCGATRLFSTNSGSTWSTIDPGTIQSLAGAKVIIQWWLNAPLPPNKSGYAWFKAQVPGIAPSSSFVENRTCASFGSGASFTCDSTTTLIRGTLKIGDQVFRDENLDGLFNSGDTGITGVTVSLYWDKNNDDKLDQNDVPIAITTTNSSGGYLFDLLPNGDYLVAVSETIPPIPTGYRHTTNTVIPVTLAGSNVLTADFGFGPALDLRKTLVDNPAYEGQTVRYVLTVQNLRPGGGESVAGGCRFKTWATVEASQSSGLPTTKSWLSDQLALSAAGPDGSYAYSDYTNAVNNFAGTGYSVVPQSASISKVEAVLSIYVDGGQLVDDNVAADLYFNDAIVASKTFTVTRLNTYGIGQAKQANLSWDISGTRSWSWGDFAGNLDLMAITNKSGPKDGAVVHMDALGFYITTGSACPVADPADILNTVPLTDTYDKNLLTFQSAVPPVSTHDATNGQLSWGDIGPIYPGQAKSVQVNFLAKEPSPQQNSTINNTAGVTNALFPDNTKANNDYANATGTLIPTSVITGVVFSDLSGNGWPTGSSTGMDPGDLGVPGVKVGLYLCAGQAYDNNKTAACPSTSWTLVMTTTTDVSGKYSFTGLPNGYYYAKVDTASLLGSFTPTTDADATPSVNRCIDSSCTTTDNEWQDLAASIKNMKLSGLRGRK